jgi:hypothetical protein
MMKRWRVGSLSMGLILLASGVLMLMSLVIRINILDILLTFWPIILISLGIEILLHLFIRKNDNTDTKLRYDALSIVFISFLLVISIGFYAVVYFAGLFDSREDMYAVFGILNDSVHIEESVILGETEELVVFHGNSNITVLASQDGNLTIAYTVSANTSSREYATALLHDVVKIEPGERAYLRTDVTRLHHSRNVGWSSINFIIYLPPDVTLDVSQFWGSLHYDRILEEQLLWRGDD